MNQVELFQQTQAFIDDLSKDTSSDDLYSTTNAMLDTQSNIVLFSYIYDLVALARLFKGFSAQPRLGVVTSTIVEAMSDILHFLVVFLSVFFAYSLAGVILFGRDLKEFSNLGNSVVTLFRMVLFFVLIGLT